jgi:tRNA-dihydrouridine synthase C
MPDLPAHWLEPLSLPGGQVLPNRIVPGPMEGITVGSFCRVLSRRGLVDCWITPFIRLTTGVPRRSRLQHKLACYHETGVPVVVQIMGHDIPLLAATAKRLAELDVIAIDLNCACPSKTVLANGAGGALLRRPEWIAQALSALRAACPNVGISVKLRTGFADSGELPDILAAMRAGKPDFTILHYRTVAEEYRRIPDGWERLAKAKELAGDIPLLASGDIRTVNDALRLWRETRVDGVAPARGLLRNPRLLRDIQRACQGLPPQPASRSERIGLLADIATDAEHAADTHHGFILEFAARSLGRTDPLFSQLAACRNLGEARALLAAATQTG